MPLLRSLVLVGGVVLWGQSVAAKPPHTPHSPYLPLADGNTWIYSVEWFFGEFSRVDTVVMGGPVEIDGKSYYPLSTPWFAVWSTYVLADSLGDIYWCDYPGGPENPLFLFSAPGDEGWLLGGRHCSDSVVRAAGRFTVTTPIGTFTDVIRIHSVYRDGDCMDAGWAGAFAPDVGPVAWAMIGAGGTGFDWRLIEVQLPPPCRCRAMGHPHREGLPGARDIAEIVDVVFCGRQAPPLPGCSGQARAIRQWTDVDCSGATNVIDLALLIDVVFFGADPNKALCAPCAR